MSDPQRYGDTIIFPASLDPEAVGIVNRLLDAGFETYLVGGCVRDLLLGRIPKDFDVSTAARPRQIRRLFRNSRIIGRRFQLVHVYFGPQGDSRIIEVATFRADPGDRPEPSDDVDAEELLIKRDNEFGTAQEDARRRDFTMNALLYDVRSSQVLDYVGGVEDLKRRTVRMIGDPRLRLAEDPVRMLRAIKFVSRLDLEFDPELDAAIRECAEHISMSAPPRVLEEIYKLLTCGNARRALAVLNQTRLLELILPEVGGYWAAHPEDLLEVGTAIDAVDRARRRLSNALLLSTLFLAPWRERFTSTDEDPMVAIRELITPAALRMNVPRRDTAAIKHLVSSQHRLVNDRRKRRRRLHDFLASPNNQEAIQLLYLAALAGHEDSEAAHERWTARLAQAFGVPASTKETRDADDDESPRPKRRRRRGGRRRRRRSSDAGTASGRDDASSESGGDDAPSEAADERRDDERDERAREGTERPRRRGRREKADRGHAKAADRPLAPAEASAPPSDEADAPPVDPGVIEDLRPPVAPTEAKRGFGGLVRRVLSKVFHSDDTDVEVRPPPGEGASAKTSPTHRTRAGTEATSSDTGDGTQHDGDGGDRDAEARPSESNDTPPSRRRRRGRRGGRRRSRSRDTGSGDSPSDANDETAPGRGSGDQTRDDTGSDTSDSETSASETSGSGGSRKRRRRGGRRSRSSSRGEGSGGGDSSRGSGSRSSGSSSSKKKSTRKRGGRRKSSRGDDSGGGDSDTSNAPRGPAQRAPEDVEDLFDW